MNNRQPLESATPSVLSTVRQLELLRILQRVANARSEGEQRVASEYQQAVDHAEAAFKRRTASIESTYTADRSLIHTEHATALENEDARYATVRDATQESYRKRRDEVTTRYTRTIDETRATQKQTAWQTLAVFDASKNTPKLRLVETQNALQASENEVGSLENELAEIIQMRRLQRFATAIADPSSPTTADDVPAAVDTVRGRLTAMYGDNRTSSLEPTVLSLTLLGCVLVPLIVSVLVIGWSNWLAYVVGLAVGGGLAALAYRWMSGRAARATLEHVGQIRTAIAAARAAIQVGRQTAVERSRDEANQLIANRDRDLLANEQRAATASAEIESWKTASLAEVTATFPARLAELRQSHHDARERSDHLLHERISELTRKYDQDNREAVETRRAQLAEASERRTHEWDEMAAAWHKGYGEVRDELAQMHAASRGLAPDWSRQSYKDWTVPSQITPAVPFGQVKLPLSKVKAAVSSDPRLQPAERELVIPTLLTLREQPTLIVTAPPAGRRAAVDMLQTMLVRFMTAMPPGKVRLTLCDPVALGESFSAFMHLADHDETLVASRIWTQPRDIDEQLLRLTSHMETILQKYLRDEYSSIHEYNAQAGEVAEPLQVLAIADFPHGMSDTSIKRLVSLVKGGPRCGIYVLLAVDTSQRIPGELKLDALLPDAVHLDWNAASERLVWQYPAYQHLPLELPAPLPGDALVRLLREVGAAAAESIKVEVPFRVVAPPPGELWQQSCSHELRVPLGRAGANRLQYVRLGKGTSQHLLVAGKTGSGKSTFLHALVTSAALHYSPSEVAFYLIDFKKGVEFKSYATHGLPHARVIAIESEREFGISVLERLDEVLRERGEKFRAAGVQSLADFRAAHPSEPLPRILLVIDEFQELFVEDDKLAGQASLLLDRLIRQGRAFGMHVVLGSQTLAGAYSLARATLGQMAVRVALQCSEADAHLILSDERNQAARFLSRPGEAVYNDQNGMVSANEPFQVVWLPDAERADYLAATRAEADRRGVEVVPPIVFEGNAPSDLTRNVALADGRQSRASAPRAWLGAAVSIKPPTSVDFARHAGSNLLIVGQDDLLATGVGVAIATSVLASGPDALVDVIDGSRADDSLAAVWRQVAEALGPRLQLVAPRDAARLIGDFADELARRDRENDESAPTRILIVHNGGRIRELRKSDNDFSFSFDKDKPASVDKQFAELLKNGPAWGLHVVLWSDSYNSLMRVIERMTLREFEHRVVLQMAAGDSSNLIDTPAASRLAEFRALLYSDESGETEKFRPYEVPPAEWLASLADRLRTVQPS